MTINTPEPRPTVQTYACYLRGKCVVVAAATLLDARDEGARKFKLKPARYHEVACVLTAKPIDPASL